MFKQSIKNDKLKERNSKQQGFLVVVNDKKYGTEFVSDIHLISFGGPRYFKNLSDLFLCIKAQNL